MTLQLAIMAMIALADRHPAGIVSAVKKDTGSDYAANVFALWGISTPNFWLGIMLIFLFSVTLGWLPASGYVPLWRGLAARASRPRSCRPSCSATPSPACIMRHTRSAMLRRCRATTCAPPAPRARERKVVLKHAMRNALTPVITLGALEFGTLLSARC